MDFDARRMQESMQTLELGEAESSMKVDSQIDSNPAKESNRFSSNRGGENHIVRMSD